MTRDHLTVIDGGKDEEALPAPLSYGEALAQSLPARTPEQLRADLELGLKHASMGLAWVGRETTYGGVADSLRFALQAAEALAALDTPDGAA